MHKTLLKETSASVLQQEVHLQHYRSSDFRCTTSVRNAVRGIEAQIHYSITGEYYTTYERWRFFHFYCHHQEHEATVKKTGVFSFSYPTIRESWALNITGVWLSTSVKLSWFCSSRTVPVGPDNSRLSSLPVDGKS